MDLYFSPLACSMATRIALYEAGAEANYHRGRSQDQDGPEGRFGLLRGQSARPRAVVRTDDGVILTENAAILQHVAERFPDSGIGARPRHRTQPGCSNGCASSAPNCTRACSRRCSARPRRPEVKAYTLEKYLSRLDYLDNYLKGREFLLDHFSVADAYLVTVLNWSIATPMIDLGQMAEREGVSRAA